MASAVALVLLSVQVVVGVPYGDPHCKPGRDTIVHLFEWKWTDVQRECPFLAEKGYCAVQVSPVSENAVITNPNRPWFERYQPVSYKLETRSGNEQQFRDMVKACDTHGIRIYVDTVFNHMTADFSGLGTGGSPYDGVKQTYPGVPYSSWDFNAGDDCHSFDGGIHDYSNPEEVRNCKLVGMNDLRLSKEYVRQTIANFLNKLITMGVAGFRIDAAKHMWPGDLANVFGRLNDLQTPSFSPGSRPFVYQEVIDQGGEPIKMTEYLISGRVTNFIYGIKLADIFLRHTNQAKWLKTWGPAWGMPDSNNVVVFIDNHDNQRGSGGGGSPITFFQPKQMKIATAFMLAHPYGFPRVMSSYSWPRNIQNGEDKNYWYGPPHNGDMSTKDVEIHADNSCGGGWICEHRWRQVYNMVQFRAVVQGTPVENWQSLGDNQIAFSRGNKGFIAIVGDDSHLNSNLQTGLPAGTYCDVISGNYENGRCTGNTVHVDSNGQAHFNIDGHSEDPVVAIHINAKV